MFLEFSFDFDASFVAVSEIILLASGVDLGV